MALTDNVDALAARIALEFGAVRSEIGGGGPLSVVTTTTDTYFVATTDDVVLVDASVFNVVVVLPTPVGATKSYTVKLITPGEAQIESADGAIDGVAGAAAVLLNAQWAAITVVSNGTDWLLI